MYGFKIWWAISKVPFEISYKIFNTYTAKYAFYEVLKIWRLMISYDYDIFSLSEMSPCLPNTEFCSWKLVLCLLLLWYTIPSTCPLRHTVYPKKYAHGFVVLCFVVVMQSFIMNLHEVFIHIHQGCFAGTGAIVRLPQCQWSKPDGYGKISQCITTTKHSKAKTVCIFLGIYCMPFFSKLSSSPPHESYVLPWLSLSSVVCTIWTDWGNVQYIPRICTRFCCALLCCGYAIFHNEFTWSIYPYSSGLLCWHWGNR